MRRSILSMESTSSPAPRRVRLRNALSSIRVRLSAVFVVAFVGIAGLSAWQLQAKMAPAFLRMEKEGAIKSAERVMGVMDAQLSSMNLLTRDWAVWDDMFEFILRPTPAFVASNMSDESLKNAGLNAVMVISSNGTVVALKTRPLTNGSSLSLTDFEPFRPALIPLLDAGKPAGRCGYIKAQLTLLLLCASPVSHSDGTEAHIGGVIMVRELSPTLLIDIATQSKEKIELIPVAKPLPERWPLPSFIYLPATSVGVSYTNDTLTLEFDLPDLAGKPLTTVRLPVDRAMVTQGQLAIRQMTLQLGVTVLVTCTLLALLVHFGFAVPLRRLQRHIRSIHENRQWETPVDDRRSDELGLLAREINGLLGVIRRQVETLTSLSMTDALTGLANRRNFDQRLEEEINRANRKKQPLSLLAIDIDYFKQFNDHYGHPEGDVALQRVAGLLRGHTRMYDLTARVGGEEFAVMLIDTPGDGALTFAQNLVQAIRDAEIAHAKSQVGPFVTISIGVSQFHPGQDTSRQLIEHADMALYAAKAAGRNQVMLYERTLIAESAGRD